MERLAEHIVKLDVSRPLWDRVFTLAPLVLVGTTDENGRINLAPKHMVTPMSWENYFGFVCAPTHHTYQNIDRTGSFTVSYPRASQVVTASLAAAPRADDDTKPSLLALPTFPSPLVEGSYIQDGYLFLGCRLERFVDGFGPNSLIVGQIVEAYVDETALRVSDREDDEVVRTSQMLAYISPGRYSNIQRSFSFPLPAGFRR